MSNSNDERQHARQQPHKRRITVIPVDGGGQPAQRAHVGEKPGTRQRQARDAEQPRQEPARLSTEQEEIADMDNAVKQSGFTQAFSSDDINSRLGMSGRGKHGGKPEYKGQSPVISFKHVTKSYEDDDRAPVLKGIDFDVYPGECVILIGQSGAGKTTIMRLLNRTIKATSGSVEIAGQDIGKLPDDAVPQLRRQIGTVFQDYKLLKDKTTYDNVAFALRCVGKSREVVTEQVPEALRLVGLGDKMDAFPNQLSGGEQQRVSIARAMVSRPPLLICDEPTGNLDPAISLGIVRILERINKTGTTVIISTHDDQIVDRLQQRVIELRNGLIVRDEEGGSFYGNR